ncbi:MAG TPA: hypothetical protein VHR41_19400, partial [Gemmatimonadales bacterium]|nr:hypothetical protein [Gemmatimonadales bacterium]
CSVSRIRSPGPIARRHLQVAHLAGTLRYGSTRLFRQSKAEEWPALFLEVAGALAEMVQERGRLSA